jgi:heme-degrading monooxygenase HmoA
MSKGAVMYARTSSWTGSGEALERWVKAARERVAPMVAALPGNAGAYFFVDRDGLRALTLTLWDSEAAARASDEAAEQSRAATTAATGVTLDERGRLEVVARVEPPTSVPV